LKWSAVRNECEEPQMAADGRKYFGARGKQQPEMKS
jgi:hypothetical protein